MKWVGDLSREDAGILEQYAEGSDVLEFGVGGSTMIIAQSKGIKSLTSIETDPAWIDITSRRMEAIEDKIQPVFLGYSEIPDIGSFDMIFVDGVDNARFDFAVRSWKLLKPMGFMLFHDTRRFPDFKNVLSVAESFYEEILSIQFNINYNNKPSNMTVMQKRNPLKYVNWPKEENKPEWSYGIGEGLELYENN